MVNIALENSTNLGKYDIWYAMVYWIGMKFRPHKRLFKALGTIVSRKFRLLSISLKVKGNTVAYKYIYDKQ